MLFGALPPHARGALTWDNNVLPVTKTRDHYTAPLSPGGGLIRARGGSSSQVTNGFSRAFFSII